MSIFKSLLLAALISSSTHAQAVHSGGVGSCSVCHAMHTLADGFPVMPTYENNYLLRANSPSDMCLSCHAAGNGAVWADNLLHPSPERGGGNFIFTGAPNINDAPNGAMFPLSGSHGVHNCDAPSQNSKSDPVHQLSPGGNYPSASLGCTSCHDPHGNENFRLLHGVGRIPAGNFVFSFPAPVADGIPLQGAAESQSLHTAYKSGWTNWCRNCHGLYHEETQTGFEHPVRGPLSSEARASYELYNGTADPTGGNPLTSYLPQVPFESSNVTINSTNGPDHRSEITCISCHRAHGSSAVDLGRWDFRVVNLGQDGSPSGSFPLPNPFNSGTTERQLCVKCHEQETRTHGFTQACIECHRTDTRSSGKELLPTPIRRPK